MSRLQKFVIYILIYEPRLADNVAFFHLQSDPISYIMKAQ